MKTLLTTLRRAAYAAVGFCVGVLLMPALPFYLAVCGWTVDNLLENERKEARDGK